MKWSNILQRTGIIGSNPIVAALDVGAFPVEICEIHSLGRYSRKVLIGTPPPIAPQKWTRGKEREVTDSPGVGTVPVVA